MDRVMTRPPAAGLANPAAPRRRSAVIAFLYWLHPEWFAPRKVCAWCRGVIAGAGVFSRHKTSHGVCPRCSEEAMEQARIARGLAREIA